MDRSTKAGDYPRLRRPPPSAVGPPGRPRSTKAGDYPRLRLPTSASGRRQWHPPLNEGRRLPPATTPSRRLDIGGADTRSTKAGDYPRLRHDRVVEGRNRRLRRSTKAGDYPRLRPGWTGFPVGGMLRIAQRRPEITPGYDLLDESAVNETAPRSTKAGDYPRLRRGDGAAHRRSAAVRSTKAGDYPRLRRPGSIPSRWKVSSAQRRPEITPGYDPTGVRCASMAVDAQRRPEITPGYDPGGDDSVAPEVLTRSTKAGDYPRLRRFQVFGKDLDLSGAAQRRPEITPGYDPIIVDIGRGQVGRSTKAGDYPRLQQGRREGKQSPLPSGAQRRPEITPGYDVGHLLDPGGNPVRSTKAGDYPRLRH